MLTRTVCTFVFALFTFYYLYCYQADLLTVMQHVLSKGQTHYDHFVGAVLITVVLLVLQICVVRIFQGKRLAWALAFVPSALCLMMLTDVEVSSVDALLEFGVWSWLSPLLMAVFFLTVYIVNSNPVIVALLNTQFFPLRELWVNLLIVVALMLSVCFAGNNDKLYHARIHAEQCIADKDYDGALSTISKYDVGEPNLSMLAVYALSRKGELAERLFDYRVSGVEGMLPDGKGVGFELYPDYLFYTYLGGRYIQPMTARQYINFQRRTNHVNKPMADYVLCAHLLDRNLDYFVKDLEKYYEVNDSVSLPRHYREALTLYMHTHSNPAVVYKDNVHTTDYEDYQALERKYADKKERKNALKQTYGNTYWYYYDYKE